MKFNSPAKALTYAKTSSVDMAFLEAKMQGGNDGIRLGAGLRKINPSIFIIFTSRDRLRSPCIANGFIPACIDAFITKPYDLGQIDYTIDMAVELCSAPKHKPVRITTFGGFYIYVDDIPVRFSNAKAGELLAVCVDAGGQRVGMYKCMEILWPQRRPTPRLKALYRKAVSYIKSKLKEYGISDIFESFRGGCRVNPENFTCDYYEYLGANGMHGMHGIPGMHGTTDMPDTSDKSEYAGRGIYMRGYRWADDKAGKMIFDIMRCSPFKFPPG